jgi:hypothetical protein
MDNWQMMMYLGTPVMPNLTALVTTGLYINDLSMHDFSRFVAKIVINLKVFVRSFGNLCSGQEAWTYRGSYTVRRA